MDLDYCGIYQIRNILNNNIYIGSAINLRKRKNRHFSELRLNKHHNTHLQRAFNKYGEKNFVFEALISCHPDLMFWYEQQFIDQWKPEYNQRKYVEHNKGIKVPQDRKLAIGNFFRGRKNSQEQIFNRIRSMRLNTKARGVSGYKGVHPLPYGKYRSRMKIDGKLVSLGIFDTPEEAHNAYMSKCNELYGGVGG